MAVLVELFIKKDSFAKWSQTDFSRERGAAKRLLAKYTDFNFFYSLNHLYGKFNSLCGLMSTKYHNLDNLYSDYKISKDRKKTYELSEKPVVILGDVPKKAQSVMEFLDN